MLEVVKEKFILNKKIGKYMPNWFPGLTLLAFIAFIANELGHNFPLIGGVIIAILLGAFIRNGLTIHPIYEEGIKLTLQKALKFAIILLGTSLSFAQIMDIGSKSIIIIITIVILGIFLTIWFGKLLKIDGTLGLLIGIGTSICGATAIAATKGVIKAKEIQTAYAISTIFFFNLVATFLYPWIGQLFNMSQTMFGIWVGTAVHDTSSVVAIGYLYGHDAGEIATTVKLARTLFLLPLIILIGLWMARQDTNDTTSSTTIFEKIRAAFPWFIVGFILMSIFNSLGLFNSSLKEEMVTLSKFLILMVMVGVGIQIELKKLVSVGPKPLLTGLFASICVSIVSLLIIVVLGLG
jgi:uncharacterized integral membrane protein (TIGR00698 family)